MDQYGALLFQIVGQQLSVAPLGGHSSASRLFLRSCSLASRSYTQTREAATVDSSRAPIALDRTSPFRPRESPGSGDDFSPARAATLPVARWERWQPATSSIRMGDRYMLKQGD